MPPDELLLEMAQAIESAMQAQRLTRERLARQSGVAIGTLERLLKAHNARVTTIAKIADGLGYEFVMGFERRKKQD